MMNHFDTPYFRQATLLLRCIPIISEETCFALKGGTAINFFVRDLPRLSVDIDLTYLPVEDRQTSLNYTGLALESISHTIERTIPGSKTQKIKIAGNKYTAKVNVSHQDSMIKIEPNLIIRGAVFPAQELELVDDAQRLFNLTCTIQVLSTADLYGGKLCAALDRQNPRDLYDIKLLLDNEGITESIRHAFIIYLISHNRPMYELLELHFSDISDTFDNDFVGMTLDPISLNELQSAREGCLKLIHDGLTDEERRFIISIKEGEPMWDLFPIPHVRELPAVQWKLMNIKKMNRKKHSEMLNKLKSILES